MRITNAMLSNSFLTDMNVNLENLGKIQHQMSTLKEFSSPSDDPVKVARAMQLHTDVNANKQYNVNIKNAISNLDTADTALGQAGDVMKRVSELLIAAGNAAYGTDEKKAIKDEINQKISEFAQIMNTNFDGKYLFGGTRGTTKPMDAIADGSNTKLVYYKEGGGELDLADPADIIKYKQIGSKLNVEISQGVTVDYNVCASEMLNFPKVNGSTGDLRKLFSDIVNHLDSSLPSKIAELTNGDLTGIKEAMNNLLALRSEVGAKENRMDGAKVSNEDENFNLTDILSSIEDVNITQKTMEFATMQTVYMAALQTSAKVIQPSLLDYLR